MPDEDIFDELNELHISSGQCGRNNMKRACSEKFCNVTQEIIMLFLKNCEFCITNVGRIKKGIVVKLIVSKDAFSRF